MTTRSPALSVRPDLRDVAPYVSPQRAARFRMNTNESPYPPPDGLVRDVTEKLREIALNRYPDRDSRRLYTAIAGHVDWPEDGIWIANGSNEVFLHLFLAFGGSGRTSMTFEPTYSLHSSIPRIAGTRTVRVVRDDDFEIDIDTAIKAIEVEQPEVVIVCSPNNPTGDSEPLAKIERLLDAAPGVVVVDEAYDEFARVGTTSRALLRGRSNLIVTKTFSKAWRLAGVRIGYMLAAPELIAEMARVRLPYHLSAIAQVIGEAAIAHSEETLTLVRAIVRERDRIVAGLATLGVKTFPSQANFVLFEVDEPGETWDALLARGVLVRSYAGMDQLDRCLRVTAGRPDETDAFLRAMQEVLEGA